MFISAKLLFESYVPAKLTKGMWFKQRIKDVIYGKIYIYDRIFELTRIPISDDEYVSINGYPVQPIIMSITANPDDKAVILAKHDKIGWWDEEPWNDEQDLRDIELNDINLILSDYDSEIDIHVNDAMFEKGIVHPIIYFEKVTLGLPTDKSSDIPDKEDDYEDMDEMDDLTETEWPYDQPKEKTDYDPQDYETE